jgi:hypothetical protein
MFRLTRLDILIAAVLTDIQTESSGLLVKIVRDGPRQESEEKNCD